MHETNPNKHDPAFESFMSDIKRDAELASHESKDESFNRMLTEIHEDIWNGLYSEEIATAALAKLDIVKEASRNPELLKKAEELRADIRDRYPLPPPN